MFNIGKILCVRVGRLRFRMVYFQEVVGGRALCIRIFVVYPLISPIASSYRTYNKDEKLNHIHYKCLPVQFVSFPVQKARSSSLFSHSLGGFCCFVSYPLRHSTSHLVPSTLPQFAGFSTPFGGATKALHRRTT